MTLPTPLELLRGRGSVARLPIAHCKLRSKLGLEVNTKMAGQNQCVPHDTCAITRKLVTELRRVCGAFLLPQLEKSPCQLPQLFLQLEQVEDVVASDAVSLRVDIPSSFAILRGFVQFHMYRLRFLLPVDRCGGWHCAARVFVPN